MDDLPPTPRHSRIALVTGAGSGIGRACAIALLHDGWTVWLVGRRAPALHETAALADATQPGSLARAHAHAAFALMREQRPQGGRIINNGSISAHTPRPGSIAYTATKHAITGLTKAAALDGRAFHIAVGQIDIGNVASDMTEAMAAGVRQADGSIRPEARMDMDAVVQTFMTMARLPLQANVLFTTVLATQMPFVGRG